MGVGVACGVLLLVGVFGANDIVSANIALFPMATQTKNVVRPSDFAVPSAEIIRRNLVIHQFICHTQGMKLLYLLLFTLYSVGYAYTFTSQDGATFDGEVVSVESEMVTILRAADQRRFTVAKARFSEKDQQYFADWVNDNPQGESQENSFAAQDDDAVPKRVLFIGNSYTKHIRSTLDEALKASPYKRTTFEYQIKGGATLAEHLEMGIAMEKIQSEDWDIVVLQCQSQTPALPGSYEESFHDSVEVFVEAIENAGAETVLYLTWGRRDGDDMNKDIFPDYKSMQEKLTDAYEKAARKNKATVAPVGEVWSVVRRKDSKLGTELYAKDGSHPSKKGAFLATCVFFRVIFEDSLDYVGAKAELSDDEATLIKEIVMDEVKSPK